MNWGLTGTILKIAAIVIVIAAVVVVAVIAFFAHYMSDKG